MTQTDPSASTAAASRALAGAWARLLACTVAMLAAGCSERGLAPVRTCSPWTTLEISCSEPSGQVDLLLMIDNSNSMASEQNLLGRELSRMVRVLASGDRDDDGTQDFGPVRSLHVGVVTSDMGAGPRVPPGETVPSCDNGFGDDGILRTVGVTAMAGCVAAYPPVFDFMSGVTDPATFARDVACVAVMGTGGCGFEQQLEAALKAVTPSNPDSPAADYLPDGYVPPAFAGGATGHGDNVNAGFVRRSSTLALVLLTDEEDCSVPDYSIFYRDPRFTSVGLNLRCFTFAADWLYPVDRYVDNFLSLRGSPARLVYAGIVGIPVDLAPASGLSNEERVAAYDRMLTDPRMIETPDPASSPPTRLLSSCDTADGGEAFPPRRMVEVARALELRGAGTTIQSICADDFRPAVDRVVELIAAALGGACLPRPLEAAADGTVECVVLEVLAAPSSGAAITDCADVPGTEPFGTEADEFGEEHAICHVTQLTRAEVAPAGTTEGAPGWFYDTSAEVVAACAPVYPPGQRITFQAHRPPTGSFVRLSCADGMRPPGAQLGSFCDPAIAETGSVGATGNPCPGAAVPSGAPDRWLSCDAVTRSCVVRCTTDAECIDAGLVGFVCDRRAIRVVTGNPSDPGDPYDVCVNAACR